LKALLLFLVLGIALTGQPPDQAKSVVGEAVAALGGDQFLQMQNFVQSGRAYSFYRNELKGLALSTIYTKYVDNPSSRKGLLVVQRQNFGKKDDYAYLYLQDQGWDVTFRGARPLPDELWKRYQTSTSTNILYLLRTHFKDTSMSYDFVRSDVVVSTHVNIVDVTDPENRVIRVYFDFNSKLPIRQEYSEWDPVGRQRSTEVTDFSKYRESDGVNLPLVVHRERNGEKVYELFADKLTVNAKLPENIFALPTGVKILKKVD
jgi:hypothetical protein